MWIIKPWITDKVRPAQISTDFFLFTLFHGVTGFTGAPRWGMWIVEPGCAQVTSIQVRPVRIQYILTLDVVYAKF